jgi:hypothetical protein
MRRFDRQTEKKKKRNHFKLKKSISLNEEHSNKKAKQEIEQQKHRII